MEISIFNLLSTSQNHKVLILIKKKFSDKLFSTLKATKILAKNQELSLLKTIQMNSWIQTAENINQKKMKIKVKEEEFSVKVNDHHTFIIKYKQQNKYIKKKSVEHPLLH